MDRVLLVAMIVVSLGGLTIGAELVVRGAALLALRFGVSPLAVGLTVVAFGTSTPELTVSVDAALRGSADIALGNIVGSNVCNIALILGVAALIRPLAVHASLFRFDVPVLISVSIVLAAMLLLTGGVSRLQGGLLLIGLLAYTVHTLLAARREPPQVAEEFSQAAPAARPRLGKGVLFVGVGLLALVGGGSLLVRSAIALAGAFGVSEAVIGLTVVAVGTSLPELATSVVAAVRGKADIAVGNVVGSNIFNILGIIGVTALVRPLTQSNIDWVSVVGMIVLALVLLPIARSGFVVSRAEGGVLLALYLAYVGWLVAA